MNWCEKKIFWLWKRNVNITRQKPPWTMLVKCRNRRQRARKMREKIKVWVLYSNCFEWRSGGGGPFWVAWTEKAGRAVLIKKWTIFFLSKISSSWMSDTHTPSSKKIYSYTPCHPYSQVFASPLPLFFPQNQTRGLNEYFKREFTSLSVYGDNPSSVSCHIVFLQSSSSSPSVTHKRLL